MTRLSRRDGTRVNQRIYTVPIESDTANDDKISYRALGLLVHMLNKPADWQMRSEQLSKGKKREGRDAVRKVLHELAAAGYYRLERRRFRDGTTAMGTAISFYPVKQWAQDYVTFGQKLDVPVVEQEDGTFLVRYPDNTLGSDGFAPGQMEEQEPDAEPSQEEAPEPKPTRKTPPAAARSARKKKAAANTDSAPDAAAEDKATEGEAKKKTPAQEVATWYYEHATKHLGPYAGAKKSGWYFGLLKLSEQAIEAGYTKQQIAKAFQRTGIHFPTAHQFQRALSDERNNKPMPSQYGGRPAPYSDAETWGTPGPGAPPTSTPDAPDDAVFGIDPA
ncbi:hypothetical protein GTY65_24045 [Streptomyces sp. SID8379]|uniref:hypothetical protein n=1 Tax=unclassified Streptomyces TaxID=2593676 RepID=UPI0003A2EF9B|nr:MULTISPECIES: hypothetical protein [unclassified Streptomyces]MYW67115.1 hypothetical protein [Streptomyces sp. SID8379]